MLWANQSIGYETVKWLKVLFKYCQSINWCRHEWVVVNCELIRKKQPRLKRKSVRRRGREKESIQKQELWQQESRLILWVKKAINIDESLYLEPQITHTHTHTIMDDGHTQQSKVTQYLKNNRGNVWRSVYGLIWLWFGQNVPVVYFHNKVWSWLMSLRAEWWFDEGHFQTGNSTESKNTSVSYIHRQLCCNSRSFSVLPQMSRNYYAVYLWLNSLQH